MGQFIKINGDYGIKLSEGGTIKLDTGLNGQVEINGDLTVWGNRTSITSEDLIIKDNLIVLNKDETGPGVTLNYAGIKIDRGSSVNVGLIWDETKLSWAFVQGSESSGLLIGNTGRLLLKSLEVENITITGAVIEQETVDTSVIDDLTVNTFRGTVDSGTYPVLPLGDLNYDPDNNLAKTLIKRNFNAGEIPNLNDIDFGEMAVNIHDGKLFIRRKYIKFGSEIEEISEFVSSVPIKNTIFIQKNGNDDYDGTSWSRAVLTFERALQLANEQSELNEVTLIDVGPGVYVTQGELSMPDNTAIRAAHRTVIIKPESGFEVNNVFLMGSGCFIEGPVFENWQLDDMDNPTKGFAVAFRPGALIRRVPYAHKITVRNTPNWTSIAPPLDRNATPPNPLIPPAGGVALADGAVCSPYSIFPNIMAWGATPVLHNGIGYCAKNGGLINAINAVSIWCHKHFYAIDGGQLILSGCSTQFGDFTLVSKGSRNIVTPLETSVPVIPTPGIYDIIISATETFANELWNELVQENYTDTWFQTDEDFTRLDTGKFLNAMAWTLETGNQKPMLDFAKCLFDFNGQFVFSADKLPAFIFSFEFLRDKINELPEIDTSLEIIVNSLVETLVETLNNPILRREPSTITAIGHTWTGVMAGVALTKIPPARNKARIQESILEIDRGVVIASGQDDQGSAIFVGGLEIDADTGELGGPPFISAVNRISNKISIARSF
jgi:hypothetical protein